MEIVMKSQVITVMLMVLVISLSATELKIMKVDQKFGPDFVGWAEDRIIVTFDYNIVDRFNQSRLSEGRTGIAEIDVLGDQFQSFMMRKLFTSSKPKTINGKQFDYSNIYKIMFRQNVDLDQVEKAYKVLPFVKKVERVGMHSCNSMPNDAQFYKQWHLHRPTNDCDIDAPEGWDYETGDEDIIVAIMDSGVRYYHVDLGGSNASYADPTNVDGNMWVNWTEKNGTPGVDDDSNGFVDDWIGWDFVDGAAFAHKDEDATTPDNDPRDFNGHGTHCAGNVGTLNNNGGGLCGVAGGWGNGTAQPGGNGIKVMALRIGYHTFIGLGVILMDAAAEAMYYAADNGARIASCSWGSSESGGMPAAVDYFLAHGGLVFHAAGNDNNDDPDYLDNRGDCISVAATDSNDHKADFSNYGTWVDISAPGTQIWSLVHNYNDDEHDYIAAMGGTSMSTPMAAGVAALIWSQNPTWTAAQVRQRLYDTADDIEDNLSPTHKGKMGAGRINAWNAVMTGENITVTAPNGAEILTVGDNYDITWTSAGTSGNVKIELSTNTGGSWTNVIASTPDDGTFNWLVPDSPSTTCLIKVSDTVGTPNDISDAVFTIQTGNVNQTIPLTIGWNIYSLAVTPDGSQDMLDILNPILEDYVIKVIDENGSTIEKIFGNWQNYIGDWQPTEGYYIKVDENVDWDIIGMEIETPLAIPLTTGWNMISYPCLISEQDAIDVLQALIDDEYLIKVIDETGNTIEKIFGNWQNYIGDFKPGEGYYVKVTETCTLYVDCGATALSKKEKSENPKHFVFENDGNPYHPMSVYLLPGSTDFTLDVNDEIALFDGSTCVGASIVENLSAPLLIVAYNQEESDFGFSQGNPIQVKIWKSQSDQEITFSNGQLTAFHSNGSPVPNQPVFEGLGSIVLSLDNVTNQASSLPSDYMLYQNFPNPFNPSTEICYDLPEAAQVSITVYDIQGRKVKELFHGEQNAGMHKIVWNGLNENNVRVVSGLYLYSINTANYTQTRKMIFVK